MHLIIGRRDAVVVYLVLLAISLIGSAVLYYKMDRLKGQLLYEQRLRKEYLADIAHWQGIAHSFANYQADKVNKKLAASNKKLERVTADTLISRYMNKHKS
jgi:hypothetical protein